MPLPSFQEVSDAVDKDLRDAELLSGWVHWAIGTVVVIIGCAIENPKAMDLSDAVAWAIFGLLAGWISFVLGMRLLPQPYAWLARRLGLVPQPPAA
jgi:hypothetical protein